MKRIAINGFGRIGRASLKITLDIPGLEVIAINDLMTLENAAYLFKYDSVYRHTNPRACGVYFGYNFYCCKKYFTRGH